MSEGLKEYWVKLYIYDSDDMLTAHDMTNWIAGAMSSNAEGDLDVIVYDDIRKMLADALDENPCPPATWQYTLPIKEALAMELYKQSLSEALVDMAGEECKEPWIENTDWTGEVEQQEDLFVITLTEG